MVNALRLFVYERILHRSDVGKRIFNGAFWMGAGSIVSKGLTVLASISLSHLCGKRAFGEYGIIIGAAGTFSTVSGLGLGHTIVKYVAEFRVTDPARASRIMALTSFLAWGAALVLGVVTYGFAPWIAKNILAAPHLADLLRIVTSGVVFGVMNEVQLASLSGCEAFKERSWITVATGILQALLLVAGAYFYGLRGAVCAFSLSCVFTFAVTSVLMRPVWRRYHLFRMWSGMFHEAKVLLTFSLPTILLLLLGYPVSWITNVFLTRIPDGYSHVAVISAVSPWTSAVTYFVTIVCTAMVPVLSNLVGNGERKKALRLVAKICEKNLFVVLGFCFILSLLGSYIMGIYGSEFRNGGRTFNILIWTAGLGALYQPMWNYLVGSGLMWTNFIVVFSTAMIQIFAGWCSVRWGSEGLAWSRFGTTVVRLAVLAVLWCVYWKQENGGRAVCHSS